VTTTAVDFSKSCAVSNMVQDFGKVLSVRKQAAFFRLVANGLKKRESGHS
jgi:hypothetical protein